MKNLGGRVPEQVRQGTTAFNSGIKTRNAEKMGLSVHGIKC